MNAPPLACPEVVAALRDRLDELLEPQQAARLDEHVAACAACARVASLAGRAKAARELAWPVAAAAPSLERAIRTRHAAARRSPWPRLVRLVASHAAALAIGVGLAHAAGQRNPSSPAAPPATVGAAADDVSDATAASGARHAAPSAGSVSLTNSEADVGSPAPASRPQHVFLASPRRLR